MKIMCTQIHVGCEEWDMEFSEVLTFFDLDFLFYYYPILHSRILLRMTALLELAPLFAVALLLRQLCAYLCLFLRTQECRLLRAIMHEAVGHNGARGTG